MSLWAANLILATFTVAALASGIWLFLHLDAVAKVFAGKADVVPAPSKRSASRGKVWLMLAIFNIGWIVSILIWIYVIGGDANRIVDATV